MYSYNEPDIVALIRDITLVREGGRLSEQTFGVSISVSDAIDKPPATLQYFDSERADYGLSYGYFTSLLFPPSHENIKFFVTLFHDDQPEETEAFQATSAPLQGFPSFGPPSMGGAFVSTEVHIIDDDCKLTCSCIMGPATVARTM